MVCWTRRSRERGLPSIAEHRSAAPAHKSRARPQPQLGARRTSAHCTLAMCPPRVRSSQLASYSLGPAGAAGQRASQLVAREPAAALWLLGLWQRRACTGATQCTQGSTPGEKGACQPREQMVAYQTLSLPTLAPAQPAQASALRRSDMRGHPDEGQRGGRVPPMRKLRSEMSASSRTSVAVSPSLQCALTMPSTRRNMAAGTTCTCGGGRGAHDGEPGRSGMAGRQAGAPLCAICQAAQQTRRSSTTPGQAPLLAPLPPTRTPLPACLVQQDEAPLA